MSLFRILFLAALTLLAAGCATPDSGQSAEQSQAVKVDPMGIRTWATKVNMKDYGAVLLVVSDLNAPRVEFLTRQILGQVGRADVVNLGEFQRWTKDVHFPLKIRMSLLATW